MIKKLVLSASLCALSVVGLVRCVVRPPHAVGARPPEQVEHHVTRGRPGADLAAACGEGGLTDHGRQRVVRQPYIQNVSGRSASWLWTSMRGDAAVEVTNPDGSFVAKVPAAVDRSARPATGRQLTATAIGLEPGTVYCYAIGDERGALTHRAGFRTARPARSSQPVRFAAFGDSGDGSRGQFDVLRQLGNVPYDLMVVTGDVAYNHGTLREFEDNFFAVYKDLLRSVPVMPIAGNHDYRTDDAGPFREVFQLPENGGREGKERWYSFDYGDVHFVALDTERMSAVQAAWLDRDLESSERPWTVVYAHKGPYSSGMHGSNIQFREYFGDILEKHRVPLVLTGHEHHYERTRPISGVTYVVTGGGGKAPRNVGFSDFTVCSESILHFVHVTVEPKKMTLVAIDDMGREFDSVAFER